MIPEIDIWRTANVMVRRYGSNAPEEALERAGALMQEEDPDGAAIWRRIAEAARQLLATEPAEGEWRN